MQVIRDKFNSPIYHRRLLKYDENEKKTVFIKTNTFFSLSENFYSINYLTGCLYSYNIRYWNKQHKKKLLSKRNTDYNTFKINTNYTPNKYHIFIIISFSCDFIRYILLSCVVICSSNNNILFR